MVEKQPLSGKKITKAEVDAAFVYSQEKNRMDCRTYSDLTLAVENRKAPVKMKMFHTYCPFCGEKYEFPKEGE